MSLDATTLVLTDRRTGLLARVGDYVELSKPRIASLVLVVVAVAALVGSWNSPPEPWLLAHALIGTALIAASASALNQLLERERDARMQRTANRPIAAGRLQPSEALAFGVISLLAGVIYLQVLVNPQTAALGIATWIAYVAIYTPLKPITSANTAIGAVAGAMPVLIGWAAVGGSFSLTGGPVPGGLRVAALFLIVYLWQFPHFMAIAWIYRHQYAAAGMQMLTVVDPSGRRAGLQAVTGSLALIPVSLLPAIYVSATVYVAGALLLGFAYFAAAVWFCLCRDDRSARVLLRTSLVYLPALLVLLLVSPLI